MIEKDKNVLAHSSNKILSMTPEAIYGRNKRAANKERYKGHAQKYKISKSDDQEYIKKRREQHRRYAKERRIRIENYVAMVKDKPCLDCGIKYHKVCMDFDHVRGDKLFNICHVTRKKYWTYEQIMDEIAKCDVVCSNCHRLRTRERKLNEKAS